MPLTGSSVRFGDFEIDLKSAELSHNGDKVRLQDQPFHILVALLEQQGKVVTREELRHRLWPSDVYVDYERSLNAAVKRLRQALGDEAEKPRYIETLPRLGYRFVGQVKPHPEPTPQPSRRLWWVAGSGLALVLIALGLFAGHQLWHLIFPPPIRSLAVLPLKSLTQEPQQEYFADGMSEAIIGALSRLEPLRVISFTSVRRYKNTTKPLPQIAKELGVDGIVEGSVLREGDQVRIRARLVRVQGDKTVWSENYDRDMRDILRLQALVAYDIATQIQINISAQEQAHAASIKRIDPEVHEAYLQGIYFENRSQEERAIQAFERAIEKDPYYAPAYARLAGRLALTPPSVPNITRARELAHKALALDESLGDAHTTLGTIYFTFDWNWTEAEKELKRALQLDPGSARTRDQYAYVLACTGRLEEAVAEARQALRLDPLSILVNINYGRMLYLNRRYEDAIAQYTQTINLDSRMPVAYMHRGYTKQAMGRYDEAFADFRKAATLGGDTEFLKLLDENKGPIETLRGVAKLMEGKIASGRAQIPSIAMAYAQAGDIDEAFRYLNLAFQNPSRNLVYLKVEPAFDNLRSDPRFKEMLKRLNLPE